MNRQDAKGAKKRKEDDFIFSLFGVLGVLDVVRSTQKAVVAGREPASPP
jgi:hypothetical protein